MKKPLLFVLTLLFISGCSGKEADSAQVELVIFAAASLTESLNEIAVLYSEVAPDVTLVYNFDSSGTLKTQIESGADCDIFLSAAQLQMNQLDADGLDMIVQGTRMDLLENKVTLIVPEGNPAGIFSFEDVMSDTVSLVAVGNADVPVGQYSEEIFSYLGIWDALNENHKITFASNVKEITAQVSEGAVDCGIVYGTDASAAGLEVVAEAPEGSHQQVVYPAAVLNITEHEEEAMAFLKYLQGEDCTEVFMSAGFSN